MPPVKAADLIGTVRNIVGDDRSFVILLKNPVDDEDSFDGDCIVDMASSAQDEDEVDQIVRAAIDPQAVEVPFGAIHLVEN